MLDVCMYVCIEKGIFKYTGIYKALVCFTKCKGLRIVGWRGVGCGGNFVCVVECNVYTYTVYYRSTLETAFVRCHGTETRNELLAGFHTPTGNGLLILGSNEHAIRRMSLKRTEHVFIGAIVSGAQDEVGTDLALYPFYNFSLVHQERSNFEIHFAAQNICTENSTQLAVAFLALQKCKLGVVGVAVVPCDGWLFLLDYCAGCLLCVLLKYFKCCVFPSHVGFGKHIDPGTRSRQLHKRAMLSTKPESFHATKPSFQCLLIATGNHPDCIRWIVAECLQVSKQFRSRACIFGICNDGCQSTLEKENVCGLMCCLFERTILKKDSHRSRIREASVGKSCRFQQARRYPRDGFYRAVQQAVS